MRSLVSHPAIQLRSVSHRYHAMRRGTPPISRARATSARDPEAEAEASQASQMARLEAVLFLAREPLGSRKIAQLANLTDGTQARTLMRRLNKQYDVDGRAFRVEEIAQGYHLLTRPKFAPWLRRLTGTDTQVRFSHPALETLAVVAYRQPVLRAEIESVRGVQCGEILRQLMERGMVRIVGRADELGRPMLYGTTRSFLQTFGLKHLDDLPRAELLRRPEETSASDETSESDAMTSDSGDLQETSEMPLDPEAEATTAVAELEEDAMGDEVFDDDLDDDLDEDDDEWGDEDDDDGLEDGEWEEVGDDDLEEGKDDKDDKDDKDNDDDLSDEDLNGDDWDDDDDDWEEGDDEWGDDDDEEEEDL